MISKKKPQIVVVDDDLEIHDLILAFFKPRNFEVICFADEQLAIQESLKAGNTWDVLLTDYHFSNMLSLDFTQEIKKNLPDLPIILITPLALAETAVRAIEKGAYDFIHSPIHFGQLQVAVDRALNMRSLKENLSDLREKVKVAESQSNHLIGRSPNFLAALNLAKRVATSTSSILISGESGTGKEVFANFIHSNSKRSKGPFTAINCSSIPENLLESELFGHAKGSFTGALDKRIGLFEAAEDGTLFLDEIGDLNLALQAKLLRVLQEKKIKRVGENQDRPINCRIISATHKDLSLEVKEHRFREDLFFRINVIPLTIPPLRDRKEDLLPLAEFFLKKFAVINESSVKSFSSNAVQFLLNNKWPGNVRELENTIERAVVLCEGTEISLEHLVPLSTHHFIPDVHVENFSGTQSENTFLINCVNHLPSLEDVINSYISYAVKKNGGARDKTAKEIGIDRKTLYKRMHRDDLSRIY